MDELEFLDLFIIAEASREGALLDRVENVLKAAGENSLVAALTKLQQDVSIAINDHFNPPTDEPDPGPQTAKLHKDYECVHTGRLDVLKKAQDCLNDEELKNRLEAMLSKLPQKTPPATDTATNRKPPHNSC